MVRSGLHVREHEGGESVLCMTTGGFWLFMALKGAAPSFDLDLACFCWRITSTVVFFVYFEWYATLFWSSCWFELLKFSWSIDTPAPCACEYRFWGCL